MKKIVFLWALFFGYINGNLLFAQATEIGVVKKEVKLEYIRGEKVLTVITHNGNTIEEEVYKGPDADTKYSEIMASEEAKKAQTREVAYTEINGVKRLMVRTKRQGEATEEIYLGKEAEQMLEQLDREAGIDVEQDASSN